MVPPPCNSLAVPPATHDYSGQGVGLYDDALLLIDAAHIHVGDCVLIGTHRAPVHYRVRYVAYCAGHPEYWRVQIEALEPVPVEAPKKVES